MNRGTNSGFVLSRRLGRILYFAVVAFLGTWLLSTASCSSTPEKTFEEQMDEEVAYFADLNCRIKARSMELPFIEGSNEENDKELLELKREQESLTVEYRNKYSNNPEHKKAFSFKMREAYRSSKYCGEVMKKYGLKETDFRKTGSLGLDKEK
jgi:hypothetical protein